MRPPSTASHACKICGGTTALYGVVDLNKSCEEHRGFRLPLAGIPVYYRRCAGCGFLFTDAFDDCTGFRMPAVGELDACAWPASESRQGTNPRSGVHGDGALAMGIWLTRDSRDGGRAQL